MNRTLFILLATLCVLATGYATEPTVGRYTKVSVADENVMAAARFAVQAQSHATPATGAHRPKTLKLLKVLRAEQQVVAGTNFRLKLRVEEGETQKTVQTVVWWQPWRKPNPYALTYWK